jgi:nucleotide-binding universal stress UspA family protein
MTSVQHVLCPVDFSDASRSSVPHALAVANYFSARLTLLTVDDPLLAEVAAHAGPSLVSETASDLRRFCAEVSEQAAARASLTVAIGKPAPEILRAAREDKADLIVMSSEGRSGARKMFFGSTAERVLRETTIPVLLTPAAHRASDTIADTARWVNRIIVPVDLSAASAGQVRVAAEIASVLSLPLLLVHVLEPVFVPYNVRVAMGGVDAARRERAEEQLASLAGGLPANVHVETLVLTGDPSTEISKVAAARHANLLIIGLHSEGMLGPRMGSVTYRILCLTRVAVLGLPPHHENAGEKD